MGTIAIVQTKASLIECLVGLAAMYGFLAGGYTVRLINALWTAVVAALWSTKRRSGFREIVLVRSSPKGTLLILCRKCSLLKVCDSSERMA